MSPAARDHPRDHRVRIPHLAGAELITGPPRGLGPGCHFEHVPSELLLIAEAPGTVDGLGDVRYVATAPEPARSGRCEIGPPSERRRRCFACSLVTPSQARSAPPSARTTDSTPTEAADERDETVYGRLTRGKYRQASAVSRPCSQASSKPRPHQSALSEYVITPDDDLSCSRMPRRSLGVTLVAVSSTTEVSDESRREAHDAQAHS